jgi:hypothetical protein
VRFLLRVRIVPMTEEESTASFRQAKLIMQAGINSSLAGEDEDALTFFGNAEHRFKKLRQSIEAGIARGWIDALKKHQQEKSNTHASALG